MEHLLAEALGVKVIVEKRRKIFFLENVKIHLDEVPQLGSFVEIEASNLNNPSLTAEKLNQQCAELMAYFNIQEADLVENSYSDMLLGK